MKPAIFVLIVVTCFASITFPPLGIPVGFVAVAFLAARALERRRARQAEAAERERLNRFYWWKGLERQDNAAPTTNPGWEIAGQVTQVRGRDVTLRTPDGKLVTLHVPEPRIGERP